MKDIYYLKIKIDINSIQEVRNHIGIVFQNPDNQFVGSTVKFDVAFGLENHAVPHDEMQKIVDRSLSEVDMLDKADYEPHSLREGRSNALL